MIPWGVYPKLSGSAAGLARDLRFAAPPFLCPRRNSSDLSIYREPVTESTLLGRRIDGRTGMAWQTGSSAYLKTATNRTAHRITGALTGMCWAKKTADLTYNIMAGYRQGAGQLSWWAEWNASSVLFSTSSDGSTLAAGVTGSSSLTSGQRYHLAWTYVPSDRICIYVNGVLDGTTTSSVPSALFNSTAAGISIGADTNGNFYFQGELSHVYVWARALSAGEIKRFYDDPWVLWRENMIVADTPPIDLAAWIGLNGNVMHPHARQPRRTIVF